MLTRHLETFDSFCVTTLAKVIFLSLWIRHMDKENSLWRYPEWTDFYGFDTRLDEDSTLGHVIRGTVCYLSS
jgi:hypothetical protein